MLENGPKNVFLSKDTFPNLQILVDWTQGKNLIISSAVPSVTDLRGPYDVANLFTLLGLSMERAKAAISKNCRSVLLHSSPFEAVAVMFIVF